MKITIPAEKNSSLVFEDNEQYNVAVGVKQHSWYEVSLVDLKGVTLWTSRVDKADIKRLAKAS